jgi:hypothetical protein
MIVAARAPTADSHLVNKAYVDSTLGSGVFTWVPMVMNTSPQMQGPQCASARIVIGGIPFVVLRGQISRVGSNTAFTQPRMNVARLGDAMHYPNYGRFFACAAGFPGNSAQNSEPFAVSVTIENDGQIWVCSSMNINNASFDGVIFAPIT